jgi:hypothetical protein
MSTTDRPTDLPTVSPGATGSSGSPVRSNRGIWLDGDVLACACPDCSAPMSIRLWLMMADCWRCGTSLELTEEQEREALRLLEEREAQKAGPKSQSKPAAAPGPAPKAEQPARPKPPPKPAAAPQPAAPADVPPAAVAPVTVAPVAAVPVAAVPVAIVVAPPAVATAIAAPAALVTLPAAPVPPPAASARRLAAHAPSRVRRRVQMQSDMGEVGLWWREAFKDLPAWIASLVIHMVLLIVLALWMIGEEDDGNKPVSLVLSTHTGEPRRQGGKVQEPEPDPIEFEDPGKEDKQEEAPEEPQKEPVNEEQPPEDPEDPGRKKGHLPDPAPNPFGSGAGTRSVALLTGRKATARAELVKQEGGTSVTEAAVARGLKWLARHQNDDGSWSLHNFHQAGTCDGRCGHRGFNSDVSGTALALLPFLGAGQTHLNGEYTEEVHRGVRWLVMHQKSNGDLPSGFANSHMYAHGQGAIALCEAYALTHDDWLKEPAQKAVDFIVRAQHSAGGWRYKPNQAGDTSVVGWQLMALRSAQMAYLKVPPEAFDKARAFLDSVQDQKSDSEGGRYSYMPGQRATPTMTAEGLLCRQYSGWPHDHPGLRSGVDYLLEEHLPKQDGKLNMYYVYYATQVMHHMGGDAWNHWNYQVRDVLVDLQETSGHMAGSWRPRGGHDDAGGRLYMTALAVCTLEVYYRHLPLYRQVAVEE